MNEPPVDLTQLSATELVLLLREELKQHLRSGSPVRAEQLLAKWQGKISDEGVLDLIYQEIVLREEAGEQPTRSGGAPYCHAPAFARSNSFEVRSGDPRSPVVYESVSLGGRFVPFETN